MNPLVAVCVLLMACATSVSAIKCHQTTSDSEYSEKDCTDGSCAKVVLDNDGRLPSAYIMYTAQQYYNHCRVYYHCRKHLNPLKGRDVNWFHLAIQV